MLNEETIGKRIISAQEMADVLEQLATKSATALDEVGDNALPLLGNLINELRGMAKGLRL